MASSTCASEISLVQKNQSTHSTPSSAVSMRSLATPHDPAVGTMTRSPGGVGEQDDPSAGVVGGEVDLALGGHGR